MITKQLSKTVTVTVILILAFSGCSTTRTWNMDIETAKARIQQKLKEDDSSPEHRLASSLYYYKGALDVVRDEKDHYVAKIQGYRNISFFARRITTQVSIKPLSPTSTKVSCKTSLHRGILWDGRDSENERLVLDALEKD